MMKSRFNFALLTCALGLSKLLVSEVLAQDQSQHEPEQRTLTKSAWSLEEVSQEIEERPNDPYLQYVLSQLKGATSIKRGNLDPLDPRLERRRRAAQRARTVDLFSLFSGSLAVQESLQLDALTQGKPFLEELREVPLSDLEGPTVSSHPWSKMIGEQRPETSRLAKCVPSDQLFVRFQSVSKLLGMQAVANDYSTYVTSQTKQKAFSAGIIEQYKTQLAVKTNDLLRPAYDAAIAEIAMTSSDLNFVDGTDVTLVMLLNETTFIRAQLDGFIKSAVESDKTATLETGEFLGVAFDHATNSDRSLHVYSAYPSPELHIRSNSEVALKRLLATLLSKPLNGEKIVPLANTDEFRYIRTLMPLDAEEENGFVYLSDPFIRNLIGAEKKLTQRNRRICKTQLQMIAFAGLFHKTQFGTLATSIEELRKADCLGSVGNPIELACPDGGVFTLSEDGLTAGCSHHGGLHSMIPCCEIPQQQASKSEAEEYKQFVTEYSRYWTTFFDPIAVRLQHSPKQTRAETIILPLINSSIYQSMASTLGGDPEKLDELPVPESNIFSIAGRLNKPRLLSIAGIEPPQGTQIPEPSPEDEQAERLNSETLSLRSLGLAFHNFESAYRHFPPMPLGEQRGVTLRDNTPAKPSGLSWRVHLLPFIEESQLYNQFALNEPWDSPHNLALVEKMPDLFVAGPAELKAEGKTLFVRPFHPEAIYQDKVKGIRFRDITDGTSNTALLVVADPEHAVVWTKPDDLDVDLNDPQKGWAENRTRDVPILFADGSVRLLPSIATDEQVKKLLTRAGGEINDIALRQGPRGSSVRRNSRLWYQFAPLNEELVSNFFYNGIGNQLSVNVCDADPLVDFSVSRFLGMVGGSFNGRSSFLNDETGIFALLAMSLNVPVYVAAPVQDQELTDKFLAELDRFLGVAAYKFSDTSTGFIEISQDFYHNTSNPDLNVRAYAFHFGPITWRFYWTRIGDGLFVASKPFIIDDLVAASEAARSGGDVRPASNSQDAHGLVRVRPNHWKEVKPHYVIGWNESERRACLNNLSPIASLARAADPNQSSKSTMNQAESLGETVLRAHYECPCGGEYTLDKTRKIISCSVHGSRHDSRQSETNNTSRLVRLTEQLNDVRLELSFLEDGLHAVVTIEKKK